jgi:hypothetical protein
LNEPYILIVSAVIVSMGNFVLWWLLFDEEFIQRLEIYEEAYRDQMKQENEEFVAKMQDIIELDPEAAEIAGFGEKWRAKLEGVNRLRLEADSMRKHTVWVYYFALAAILFAAGGLALPSGVSITESFTLYSTAISWWILVVDVLVMVGLLVHFQLIENRSELKTEGEPIRDNSAVQTIIGGLRRMLPI